MAAAAGPTANGGAMARSIMAVTATERPASTRERLMDAAVVLFYEHGFHAIGLDRILDEVGVTKTTFYNHFESKDQLILAVLTARDQREMSEWAEFVRQRAGDDPRAQLLAVFDLLEEWFCEAGFPGCMFVNAGAEFPSPNDPIHHAAAAHSRNMLQGLREIAVRAGVADADTLAQQLMVVVSGALVARHIAMEKDAAGVARSA